MLVNGRAGFQPGNFFYLTVLLVPIKKQLRVCQVGKKNMNEYIAIKLEETSGLSVINNTAPQYSFPGLFQKGLPLLFFFHLKCLEVHSKRADSRAAEYKAG